MLIAICLLSISLTADAEEVVIVNPDVSLSSLSQNALRAVFGMRLRSWPDDKPIKVFVLKDENPIHTNFAKSQLSIFPRQLRRAWDRLIYSGTGQAPNEVGSAEEMLEAVAKTPGAIGYTKANQIDSRVRVMEVK